MMPRRRRRQTIRPVADAIESQADAAHAESPIADVPNPSSGSPAAAARE
jgi:hypothetical protein